MFLYLQIYFIHLQFPQEAYTSSIENRYSFIASGKYRKKWYLGPQEGTIRACVPLCVGYTIYKKFLSIQEKNGIFSHFFLFFEYQKIRLRRNLAKGGQGQARRRT
jgi:hypothetical protein